jgi:hypothetical protein
MQVLKRGHTELFRRGPDECFDSLADLTAFCQEQKAKSVDRWLPPRSLRPRPLALDRLVIDFAGAGNDGSDGAFQMNDWSFTQLCQLAKVSRDTVNRVSADTAWRVFSDTLPEGNKPLQLYTEGEMIRSIHGVSYPEGDLAGDRYSGVDLLDRDHPAHLLFLLQIHRLPLPISSSATNPGC